MSYAESVIAIVGQKKLAKSSQNIQTLITTSVSIVNQFNYNTQKRLAFYFDRHRCKNQ